MPDQSYIRESVARQEPHAAGALKYSAYNWTRERFLCGEIEGGDFSASGLEARLRTLTPGASTAIWITPFRGISATSVRVPIDLVYLDANCVVIDAVESFPLSSVSSSSRPAESILALPSNSIASAGTRAGDQLILCESQEMKQRLQQMMGARGAEREDQGAQTGLNANSLNANSRTKPARVLQFVDRTQPTAVEVQAAEVVPAAMPALPEVKLAPIRAAAEPAQKAAKPAKSWLQKLINPDPPEPRKASREALHGLAAYFFTGGDPRAHAIRDISATGLYVLTEERWYPGTVVRMTLTDQGKPGSERSLTVHASVVRWGNDGVGLQFVAADAGPNGRQILQFIQRLRS